MNIRGATAIVGYHEVPTRRMYPGRSNWSLLTEAALGAIRDAGLRKDDIDGLICQEAFNSLTVGEYTKIKPKFTLSMTVHGATAAASVSTAALAVSAGLANYVLCVMGGTRDPESGGQQPGGFRTAAAMAAEPRGGGGRATFGTEWEAPFGPVVAANGGYGLMKTRHMFEYGTTQEQFAKCAVDQRFNALLDPNAAFSGQAITIEDVLNSRYTNDPLHLLECVMPCSGAAAWIVTSAERARALPNPPVYVLGIGGPATRHDTIAQEDEVATTPVVLSAPIALQMSGYRARDMQFAEFYDCYTILVMSCLEDAGICPKGEIGPFYQSTDTTYKGTFPVNTNGGQISGGQPVGGGGGGTKQVVEATRQIMGRAGPRQVAKNDLCILNG